MSGAVVAMMIGVSTLLGACGLAALLWGLKTRQFDDERKFLDGTKFDDEDALNDGLWLAKTNVISNDILKEIDALEDKAEITNQAVIAVISNIMSVQTDTSLVHIPEAGNEVAKRCFA